MSQREIAICLYCYS